MDQSMITSAVTMTQIQKAMDTVANNLSNISTTGYKTRNATFSSLLFQNMTDQPDKKTNLGRTTPLGIREGSGAKVADTKLNMTQGTVNDTGRTLDFALTVPNRLFTVGVVGADGKMEQGFTRDGTFYLQPSGTNPNLMDLVTQSGQFVLNAKGTKILVPTDFDQLTVSAAGQLNVTRKNGQTMPATSFGIVAMKNPQLLEAQGDNTYKLPNLASLGLTATDVMTPNAGQAVVKQGALEQSNVDMTDQMTALMNMQRAYQFNARALGIGDDMMGLINQLK